MARGQHRPGRVITKLRGRSGLGAGTVGGAGLRGAGGDGAGPCWRWRMRGYGGIRIAQDGRPRWLEDGRRTAGGGGCAVDGGRPAWMGAGGFGRWRGAGRVEARASTWRRWERGSSDGLSPRTWLSASGSTRSRSA